MNLYAEIAIAAGLQLLALITSVAYLKANVKNLTGWMKRVDERGEETAKLAAKLEGHIEALPCHSCSL